MALKLAYVFIVGIVLALEDEDKPVFVDYYDPLNKSNNCKKCIDFGNNYCSNPMKNGGQCCG